MRLRTPEVVALAVPLVLLLVAVGAILARTLGDDGHAGATPALLVAPSEDGAAAGGRADRAARGQQVEPTAGSTCVAATAPRRLSVLTFNIHSARAADDSVDLARIEQEIDAWDADVVLLQEVDRGRIWTGRVDMPDVLAEELDMSWTFGSNVQRSPTNQYGTAILSRYPITSYRNTALPAPPGTQQRGLLHAVVDVDGTEVSVYDTHLENTSADARLAQMRTIVPILRADPRPLLFGGDLNSLAGSPMLAAARSVVADTWPAVGTDAGLTAPAHAPRLRIDYLMYRDGDGGDLAPLRAQVLRSAVSDHRAVRAVYRLTSDDEVCVPVLDQSR